MGASSRRIGRAFWFGATAAAVAVLTVAAVTLSAVGAAPKPSAQPDWPGLPAARRYLHALHQLPAE